MQKLLFIIPLLILAYGGFVWYQAGQPTVAELRSYNAQQIQQAFLAPTRQTKLPTTPPDAQEKLETVATQAQTLSSRGQAVLGEVVQVNENASKSGQSLQEQAVDHALYLYCKGLVNQYEEINQD